MGSCSRRFCQFWTRVLLRFIQFACSLVAYIALRTAAVSYQSIGGGQTVAVVVSTSALSFARIVNFIAFVYAFAFLIFIEWLRLCLHSVQYYEKAMDLILFVTLATASLFLLLSGVTLHCHAKFDRFVRCGGIYLAVATSLVSTLAFLGIAMLGRDDRPTPTQHPGTYAQQETPRNRTNPAPTQP